MLVVLASPLPPVYTLAQVGLGACVSVRADTMKGAGQLLGGPYLLFFVGLGGATIALEAGDGDTAFALGPWLESLSFWPCCWRAVLVPLGVGLLLLVVAGALCQCERLLSGPRSPGVSPSDTPHVGDRTPPPRPRTRKRLEFREGQAGTTRD